MIILLSSSHHSAIRTGHIHLSTLIVISNTELTLTGKTICPVSAKFDIRLRHVDVSKQQPGTEDWLGQNVQNGIGNDLGINTGFAGSVGNTPDTIKTLELPS